MTDDDDKKYAIQRMKEQLTPRELRVLSRRFGLGIDASDQERVENQLDVTREKIRKIERQAMSRGGDLPGATDRQCSFCEKKEAEVTKLIESESGVTICDACLLACSNLIDTEKDGEG